MKRAGGCRGIIGFEGLQVSCIIGIYQNEREQPQEIIVDLKVAVDTVLEDPPQFLNYNELAASIKQEAMQGRHRLLEALAIHALDRLFADFPVHWAWIRLRKPQAIPDAVCALVEWERHATPERT